jgi:hypothetical protein
MNDKDKGTIRDRYEGIPAFYEAASPAQSMKADQVFEYLELWEKKGKRVLILDNLKEATNADNDPNLLMSTLLLMFKHNILSDIETAIIA